MKDCKGSTLRIGDQVATSRYGLCTVLSIGKDEQGRDFYMTLKNRQGNGISYCQEIFSREEPNAYRVRTMKELAFAALSVQNACNLSAIVHSFSQVMSELRFRLEEEQAEKGVPFNTTLLNQHPICVLFANKISNLCGEDIPSFAAAYDWAEKQLASKTGT